MILLGLGFLAPTVSASEQDGVWVARTVEEVKADLQKEGDLFKYVIKWGDTLSVISEASNIPVDVLQEMNQASGKNLFLPHNELYFTEAETVSDTVTKHKIVIKESGASGEVRTYEVLLKKDQETKAVTFELTDVTEKVEKMTVNYSSVYQPVSAPVVERAEESGESEKEQKGTESEAPAPSAEDSATGDTTALEASTNTEESGDQSVDSSHSGAESTNEVTEKAPSGEAEENSQNTEASTGDGNSESPKSDSEKPQADEPAVEHKDSEQSLKKETEDSNKAAIDDQKKETEENIKNSNLSEERKKEALEKVEQLTEEYHKKLAEENDTEKQAALVDEYRDKLNEIDTPGVTYDSPDFKRPIESHTGGTTIDENSTVVNSALTSSNPSSQPSSSEDSSQTQPAATSDSSTTGNSGFRSAGTYQPRVTRRRRSIEEPQNTVSLYYNFDGMKDIPGFFGDPGEDNTVTIPAGTSKERAKELVEAKIQAKVQELNKRGYTVKEEIVFEQDTDVKNFNYVVTFTKQTTGTTGFRIAPKVQVRAKKVEKRDLSNKTKKINVYYNLTSLKDIAGALGELDGENVLTFS